jgi:hypothetical protein
MTMSSETTQLLDRLRVAVNADHRRRYHRRRVGGAVAVSLLVLTGAAVAAATQAPWWDSGTPPVDPSAVASVAKDNMPAKVDLSRARTVAQADSAALVAVPLDATGYCLIPTLGGRGDLGAQCEYQVANREQGDDDRLESYAQPASKGAAAWIVYGRVTDPRAASLDLGAFTVQLTTGGFFLASVPENSWATLDGQANAGKILDSSGTTLRTGCVNWGPSPNSPQAGETDTDLWSDGSGPCKPQQMLSPPTVDYSQAQKVFDVALTADFSIWKAGATISFWQAPASDGTQCIFPGPESGPDMGFPFASGDCRAASARWAPSEPAIHLGLGGRTSRPGKRHRED